MGNCAAGAQEKKRKEKKRKNNYLGSYDIFIISVSTAPMDLVKVQSILPHLFDDLPISLEELESARQPLISVFKTAPHSIAFWHYSLPAAPNHRSFEEIIHKLEALQPEEVREKIRTMFAPITEASYSSMVVEPKKK